MRMLRKQQALLLLASLTTTPAIFAHNTFEGIYGGLSVGALQTTAKISSSASASYANAVPDGLGGFSTDTNSLAINQNAYKDKTSALGVLALGYGQFLSNHFHLAGEVFVNVTHRENSLNDNATAISSIGNGQVLNNFISSELRNWEFGVDILPGYLFDQKSMIYARVGAAFNKQTLEANTLFSYTSSLGQPTDGTYNSGLSISDSKNRAGLRLGLGLEHAICPNLSATLDYIYTYYSRKSINATADITSVGDVAGVTALATTANGLAAQASSRMNTQAALLGFKWYFL